ncbi:acyl-coenzyme A thioesterase 9, mitochondrial [Platysternon megacephalum]|uniref:Acyl-coenzyme A thioesterase 9, mitochondrial n=1 Tax=Platysternon megacephalum TaxID=55544 RepID=A0A4D9EJI7_9SAUR|nr:acyl-coenzyme A thioesterase 9, mitochondrial [Platysternon megacephalum]
MRRLNAHPRPPMRPPTGKPRPDRDFNGRIQAKPEALFINCEESRKGTTQFLPHPVCLANSVAWIPSLPALQRARKIPPLAIIPPSCSDPQTAVGSLCTELMYLSILQDTRPHTWLVLPKRYKPNCQRGTVAQAPDQE